MPPGGEMADGQKYARSLVKHKIRSIRNFYITCVGKRCTYCTVHHTRRKKESHKSTQRCGRRAQKVQV
jgi:hypothetical protein